MYLKGFRNSRPQSRRLSCDRPQRGLYRRDRQRPRSRPVLEMIKEEVSILVYYVFDVMIVGGDGVMALPLDRRPEILEGRVLSKLGPPIRESPVLEATLADLVQSVKAQGLD